MTIAISVRVGEGLVYAADSTSSFFSTVNGVSVQSQAFHHAKKLLQLLDYPIGILTFGLGAIQTRNLESLVAEFENGLEGGDHDVKGVADGLLAFLKGKYDAAFPPPEPGAADQRPAMGVIVGGYSTAHFFPDEYLLTFPAGQVAQTRPPGSDFGAMWWGQTAALQRLLLGFDPGVLQWLVEQGLPAPEVPGVAQQWRDRFGWPLVFDGMPIQDAVDLGVFLANVAIGHSRFAIGPAVCGGHVDVATITHVGFTWVRRKQTVVKTDSIFF